MSLRARHAAAASAITLVTLGAAFAAVSWSVNASQQRQLDLALLAEAREEAIEADALGGDELAISARPGPAANDVGPLTKYAAMYDPQGRVLARTDSWRGHPPALAEIPRRPTSASTSGPTRSTSAASTPACPATPASPSSSPPRAATSTATPASSSAP